MYNVSQSDDAVADDNLNFADTFIFHYCNDSTEASEKVPGAVDDMVDQVLTHDQNVKDQQADRVISGIIQQ